MGTYPRQTQLCHTSASPQSTPTTTTLTSTNSVKPLASRCCKATTFEPSQIPPTLATSWDIIKFPPIPQLGRHDPPLDRCFSIRMGRSHSISSSLRHLGRERVSPTHKLSRSSSSPSLHSVSQLNKLPVTPIYRQSGSSMCNKQAMMQINFPVTRNLDSQQPPELSQAFHKSVQNFFPTKFKGRQPKQTSDPLNRVVTTKANLQENSNLERSIRHRSNGNKQKQKATTLHLASSRPEGSCPECTGLRLEQMEPNLSLPSEVATPSGSEKSWKLTITTG